MTAIGQAFVTFNGDSQRPAFTVYRDCDNKQPLDISGVQEITWLARRDLDTPPAITKLFSLDQIEFVTTGDQAGKDGQFKVLLEPADTASLTGFYFMVASLVDEFGAVSTTSTGRWQVGPGPIWTYSGDPRSSQKDAVRFLIGDTVFKDQLITDQEILYALTQRTSPKGAAADCCRAIAARFSREVDSVDAQLRTMWSSRAKSYSLRAYELDSQAMQSGGGGMPYAGGISFSDRSRDVQNQDRVPPQFELGMVDNLNAPVGPVGNETGA